MDDSKGPTKKLMGDIIAKDVEDWVLDVSSVESLGMEKNKWKGLEKTARLAPLDTT